MMKKNTIQTNQKQEVKGVKGTTESYKRSPEAEKENVKDMLKETVSEPKDVAEKKMW